MLLVLLQFQIHPSAGVASTKQRGSTTLETLEMWEVCGYAPVQPPITSITLLCIDLWRNLLHESLEEHSSSATHGIARAEADP